MSFDDDIRNNLAVDETSPTGLRWKRRGNSYAAQITIDGVPRWLGSYPTAEEAHAVYLAAKQIHHRVNMQHKTHIH